MTWWTSDADLESLSALLDVSFPNDVFFQDFKNNGKSRGIAFIEYPDESSALSVQNYLTQNTLQGVFVKVQFEFHQKSMRPYAEKLSGGLKPLTMGGSIGFSQGSAYTAPVYTAPTYPTPAFSAPAYTTPLLGTHTYNLPPTNPQHHTPPTLPLPPPFQSSHLNIPPPPLPPILPPHLLPPPPIQYISPAAIQKQVPSKDIPSEPSHVREVAREGNGEHHPTSQERYERDRSHIRSKEREISYRSASRHREDHLSPKNKATEDKIKQDYFREGTQINGSDERKSTTRYEKRKTSDRKRSNSRGRESSRKRERAYSRERRREAPMRDQRTPTLRGSASPRRDSRSPRTREDYRKRRESPKHLRNPGASSRTSRLKNGDSSSRNRNASVQKDSDRFNKRDYRNASPSASRDQMTPKGDFSRE